MAIQKKTDATFEGMRVTLLDGSKDRIAKVGKTSYRTKGGVTLKADNIQKRGRGLIEVDTGGSVKAKPKTGGSSTKPAAAKAEDVADMRRSECITKLVEAEKFEKRADAKGIPIDDLRDMVAKLGKKKRTSTKPATSSTKPASTKPAATDDVSTMRRSACIRTLLEAEVFEKQVDAKGIPIDDLRDMVANLGKKKKRTGTKPATSSTKPKTGGTKPRTPAKDEEEEKPTRRRRTVKSDESGTPSPKKLKPVKVISDALALSVETAVNDNVAKFIRNITGYDFTVACVGGVFNEERLTLHVGLLPTNASEEEIEAYNADMSDAEKSATGHDVPKSSDTEIGFLSVLINDAVPEARLQKAIDEWNANFDDVIEPKLGDEVGIGTRLEYKGNEAIVLGYSESKSKVVLYVPELESVKLVDIARVIRMEILDDPEALEDTVTEEVDEFEDDLGEEEDDTEEEADEEDDEAEEDADEFDEESDDSEGELHDALSSLVTKELLKIARKLKIDGYKEMEDEELVDEIVQFSADEIVAVAEAAGIELDYEVEDDADEDEEPNDELKDTLLDLDRKDLRLIARKVKLSGYKTLSQEELAEALAAYDEEDILVAAEASGLDLDMGEDDDGEEEEDFDDFDDEL